MTTPTLDKDVQKFLTDVGIEVDRARKLFPAPNKTLAAMGEEAGEVCKAMLELETGKSDSAHLREECVQLAAMAVRIYLDGDPGFPLSLTGAPITVA